LLSAWIHDPKGWGSSTLSPTIYYYYYYYYYYTTTTIHLLVALPPLVCSSFGNHCPHQNGPSLIMEGHNHSGKKEREGEGVRSMKGWIEGGGVVVVVMMVGKDF